MTLCISGNQINACFFPFEEAHFNMNLTWFFLLLLLLFFITNNLLTTFFIFLTYSSVILFTCM